MILFHCTSSPEAARSILDHGFRDPYVLLTNVPVNENGAAAGGVVLRVRFRLPADSMAQYEQRQNGTYRQWMVPGAKVNRWAAITLHEKPSAK
jgi:hypothetical protein